MGPGSGSGSGSDPSPGALCAEKELMKDCDVDCLDAQPDPFNAQQIFMSSEKTSGGYSTSWTILANNPANKISLNCQGAPIPFVTECKDGSWTVPKEITDLCGSIGSGDDGMMDHGSGDDGMMDHGSSSGSEDDGMMDHGSSSGSAD